METCYRLFNPAGTIWSCGLKERLPPLILEASYDQAEASRCGKSDRLVDQRNDRVELTFIQRLLDLLLKALCPFGALRRPLSASVIRCPRTRRVAFRVPQQSTE